VGMPRRMFNIATVVSLLLCVGLTAEAVRGIWRLDRLTWQTKVGTAQFTSNWGCFDVWAGVAKDPGRGVWISGDAWKEMPWELDAPSGGLHVDGF
jgi:hypothetical protein